MSNRIADDRSSSPDEKTPLDDAIALHRQGRLEEAEGAYRAILRTDPDHLEALLYLGTLRLQLGMAEEASGLFRTAIGIRPESAEAHANLGAALQALSRHDGAIAGYEAALRLRPRFAEASYGLAVSLQRCGRIEDAPARYSEALAHEPQLAEAAYGLGTVLQALGRLDEARAQFMRALEIDREYAEAYRALAALHQIDQRYEEAVTCYLRAIELEPGDAELHNYLGLALQPLERYDEARRSYEIALEINPTYADAHHNYGTLLEVQGELAAARRHLQRAVDLEPNRPGYYLTLFNAEKIKADDPHLSALLTLAKNSASFSTDQRIRLHFALGKALADTGDNEGSFEQLLQGNRLKRSSISYDEGEALGLMSEIRQNIDVACLTRLQGTGNPSTAPIFIVGMPRSGSTLVEQILASHPDVHGAGERTDFGQALNDLAGPGRVLAPSVHWAQWLSSEQTLRLGSNYLARITANSPRVGRVTDKMLSNFRLLGLIHLALPNAKIIHTRRDALDTCMSCFAQLFAAGQPFTYDLGELGRYYSGYRSLMQHWRMALPATTMLDVDYEEIVDDLDKQARRIIEFCGLEWDERCLSFYRTRRSVRTASLVQVRHPIFRSSVGRWRPPDHILRPLLDGLTASDGTLARALQAIAPYVIRERAPQ